MPRPPTPVGTYGEINTIELGSSTWKAEARFRMSNGTSKRVKRFGRTKTAAVHRLKKRLKVLAEEARGGDITPDTRFARIADLWLDELRREYKLAGKASTTPRLYAGYVKNWIKPALGELQAREVLAGPCNNLIQLGREQSYDTAKSLRAVLSAICAFAIRNGAMQVNPAKSTARLSRGEHRVVKAMTLSQRLDLIEQLETFGRSRQTDSRGRSLGKRGRVWLELPDLIRAMLATGVRLGELLALDAADVDLANRRVRVATHLVREPGVGLVRVPNRKGNGEGLLLGVPDWSVPMWRRRKLASGGGALFPSWNDEWSDPSNVINRIREAMDACGYDWVTSHVWRKTVATVLDEADLPTTAIADQLGNTPKVVEQHYRRKREANAASRAALEGMLGDDATG